MFSYAIEPHFVECTKKCVQYFGFLLFVATKVGRDGDGIAGLRKWGVDCSVYALQVPRGVWVHRSITHTVLDYIIGSILLVHVT